MEATTTFELTEVWPNIMVGYANGEALSGASSCRRSSGAEVSLFVKRNAGDDGWHGVISMTDDGYPTYTGDRWFKVATAVVKGRACPTCGQRWPS